MAYEMTTLEQLCTVVETSPDVIKFRIKSTMLFFKDGDLPALEIFVNRVVSTTDPKSDVFMRVCNLFDLTTLPASRSVAVAQGKTLYRSTNFTVEYDDVQRAIAAKSAIQGRIDALIDEWIAYVAKFLDPSEIPLPLIEDSTVKAAKQKYTLSKKTRVGLEEKVADASETLLDARSVAQRAADDVTDLASRSSLCSQIQAILNNGASAVTTLLAANNTFSTAAEVFSDESGAFEDANPDEAFQNKIDAYNAALAAFQAAVLTGTHGSANLAEVQLRLSADCLATSTALTAAQQAKIAADASVASAETALAVAQANATEAEKREKTDLSDLLSVCPEFDPNA